MEVENEILTLWQPTASYLLPGVAVGKVHISGARFSSLKN